MGNVQTPVPSPPPLVSGYTPDWGKPYGPWKTLGIALAVFVLANYGAWLSSSLVEFLIIPYELPESSPPSTSQAEMELFRTGLLLGIVICIKDILGLVLLGFVIVQGSAPSQAYFGSGKVRPRQWAMYLAIPALFITATKGLAILMGRPPNTEYWIDLYHSARPVYWLWIGVGLIGPVFEELFFRGFLYTGLRQTKLGVKGSVIVTALLFAAVHYPYGPIGLVYVFLLGLLLGTARHRSDTTTLPILMHVVWNLLFLTSCAITA